MTILEELKTKCSPELLASGNHQAIADRVNIGRTKFTKTFLDVGDFLAYLAPNGGKFLDALKQLGQTDRNVYWSLQLIETGKFNIGSPAAVGLLAELTQAHPELAPPIQTMLNIAIVPDPITELDVRKNLYDTHGNFLG